jgi:hypothetical protein
MGRESATAVIAGMMSSNPEEISVCLESAYAVTFKPHLDFCRNQAAKVNCRSKKNNVKL